MNLSFKKLLPSSLLLLLLLTLAISISLIGLFSLLRFLYPFEYKEEILAHSREHSLDPFLIAAMIRVESNFRKDVESRRGARGLMQLMPATGRWIATQIGLLDFHEDMLFDPEINIRMGTWYMASLMEEFDYNVVVVLAAYNAGRGNVAIWLREGHWSGDDRDLHSIPFPETQSYIRKVLKARMWYSKLYREYSNGGGE